MVSTYLRYVVGRNVYKGWGDNRRIKFKKGEIMVKEIIGGSSGSYSFPQIVNEAIESLQRYACPVNMVEKTYLGQDDKIHSYSSNEGGWGFTLPDTPKNLITKLMSGEIIQIKVYENGTVKIIPDGVY